MKFSIYNNVIEKDGCLYLYNSWNCKTISFNKKNDKKNLKNLINTKRITKHSYLAKILYDEGFIVNDNVDEYKIAKKWIDDYYATDDTLQVFLYVTNQCNFRCVYCPQPHESKSFSEDNWQALYKMIFDHVRNKGCNTVSIFLFGGEPLLESANILKFLKKLNALKLYKPSLKLSHFVTTNAYLLTPEKYDNLVTLGVKHFQITIDGMEETHDKTRPRIDGKGTWSKIIQNLVYINAIDDNTYFFVRANINNDNMESVSIFFDWFDKNFKNKKFNYDYQPVSKFTNLVEEKLVIDDSSNDFRDIVNNLSKRYSKTYTMAERFSMRLGGACKVSRRFNYVVTVDGKITKCEISTAERVRPVGYLKENGQIVYTENMERFKHYETSECEKCSLYPFCGARVCPEKWAIAGKHINDCLLINGKGLKRLSDNIEFMVTTDICELLKNHKIKRSK